MLPEPTDVNGSGYFWGLKPVALEHRNADINAHTCVDQRRKRACYGICSYNLRAITGAGKRCLGRMGSSVPNREVEGAPDGFSEINGWSAAPKV